MFAQKGPHRSPARQVVSEEVDGGSERVLLLSQELAIEHHDAALECANRVSPPILHETSSAAHHGALWTLPTSLARGVCTEDREIQTETPASRRRSSGEITQPKLVTLSHLASVLVIIAVSAMCLM